MCHWNSLQMITFMVDRSLDERIENDVGNIKSWKACHEVPFGSATDTLRVFDDMDILRWLSIVDPISCPVVVLYIAFDWNHSNGEECNSLFTDWWWWFLRDEDVLLSAFLWNLPKNAHQFGVIHIIIVLYSLSCMKEKKGKEEKRREEGKSYLDQHEWVL